MIIEASFDDGADHDVRLAELLARYNIRATFYIPVMWESIATIKGWIPLTKQQLLEIAKFHEIGAHTITHPLLTRVSYSVAKYEIEECKPLLESIIGQPVRKFAYPRGYATDQIRDIARKAYTSARSTLVGNTDPPTDPAWENPTVHVACQRTEYDDKHWFDYALQQLKIAKKKDGYFHIFGHSWEISRNEANWSALETLLKEAVA